MSSIPHQMTGSNKAIYILREDGDYDFVAAFSIDVMKDNGEGAELWPDQIVQFLTHAGESVIVIRADLPLLPDVLDADSPLIPFRPSPGERNDIDQN